MLCSNLPDRVYESLKTLACLANAEGPLQSHAVAERTKLPPAQIAKLLQSLKWGGFVSSQRGSHGGFWLTKRPDKLRVAEVIAFFQPKHPTRSHNLQDPLMQVLVSTMSRCREQFDNLTLADLAVAVENKSAPRPSQRRNPDVSRPATHSGTRRTAHPME